MTRINYSIFFSALLLAASGNAQTYTESAASMNIVHEHIDVHLIGGGVAVFDHNNDGFEDLYFTGGTGPDHLYENNQDGTFTEVGQANGLAIFNNTKTVGVATGDIDNDGDRDIFVTTAENFENILLLNDGNGNYNRSVSILSQ